MPLPWFALRRTDATASRPYPLHQIDSALDAVLYAVIDSVIYSGRKAFSAFNARSLPSVSPTSGTG